MTLHALVTGTLWEAPGQHTSKNGNSFVAATIKLRDGDATQWVKLLAFGTDAQAELTRLDSGDSLIAGKSEGRCLRPGRPRAARKSHDFRRCGPAVARTSKTEKSKTGKAET